jgi:transcription termination factor Rho
VSDTTTVLDAPTEGASGDTTTKPRKRTAGLSGMVLAELQSVAGELGISGTARMRKGQLIEAIKERQDGGGASAPPARAPRATRASRAAVAAPADASIDSSDSGAAVSVNGDNTSADSSDSTSSNRGAPRRSRRDKADRGREQGADAADGQQSDGP